MFPYFGSAGVELTATFLNDLIAKLRQARNVTAEPPLYVGDYGSTRVLRADLDDLIARLTTLVGTQPAAQPPPEPPLVWFYAVVSLASGPLDLFRMYSWVRLKPGAFGQLVAATQQDPPPGEALSGGTYKPDPNDPTQQIPVRPSFELNRSLETVSDGSIVIMWRGVFNKDWDTQEYLFAHCCKDDVDFPTDMGSGMDKGSCQDLTPLPSTASLKITGECSCPGLLNLASPLTVPLTLSGGGDLYMGTLFVDADCTLDFIVDMSQRNDVITLTFVTWGVTATSSSTLCNLQHDYYFTIQRGNDAPISDDCCDLMGDPVRTPLSNFNVDFHLDF